MGGAGSGVREVGSHGFGSSARTWSLAGFIVASRCPLYPLYLQIGKHFREIKHMACLTFVLFYRVKNRKRPRSSCRWQALISLSAPPPAQRPRVLGTEPRRRTRTVRKAPLPEASALLTGLWALTLPAAEALRKTKIC